MNKCIVERDQLGRVRYYPGDGVGVQGGGPLGLLSEKAIAPHTNLYHFFVIGDYIESEDDYVILESIGKGTAVGRLSWYSGKRYNVFRMNDPDFIRLGKLATELASQYGRRKYDYALYLKLFAWAFGYWAKEILTFHIPPRPVTTDMIPYKTDRDFICIELYFAVWKLVGRRIRAHGCAPVPAEVINAVHRGTLTVIDYHNGNADAWRTPRGIDRRPWACLGRAAEDIPRDSLIGLDKDGYVRPVVTVEPEVVDGKIQAVAWKAKPDLLARQGGQKRNKLHVYQRPDGGIPVRLCDQKAQGMNGIEVIPKPDNVSMKNFIYSRRYHEEGRICRHCWAVLVGERGNGTAENPVKRV